MSNFLMPKQVYKPYLSVNDIDKQLWMISPEYKKIQTQINQRTLELMELFKGEVSDKPLRFPKDLGAEHPFDFESVENVYKKVGLVAGAVNKIADAIVGDFTVEVENENAQAILDDFIEKSNFKSAIRPWIREGVLKGNGFMELDLKNFKVRVMNANNMYVKRSKKGKVLSYNQFTGKLKNFTANSNKFISFEPNQIAHLPINKIPNDPYGLGQVWPNERVIQNIILNEQDLQKLIARKAGAPIHVKLGQPGERVDPNAIDKFKNLLTFMQNRTEWVTDGNIEMNVLQFGEIGKNFVDNLNHNVEMLASGMEIPVVLLGKANVPEGLATAQKETFEQKIASIRESIEVIIEERILRPLLLSQNNKQFDIKVTFTWQLPTDEQKNERINEIEKILKNGMISDVLKASLEIECAKILELEDVEGLLIDPKDAKKEEEERKKMEKDLLKKSPEQKKEEEIPQPEVPGAKPNANQKSKPQLKEHVQTAECMHGEGCGQQLTENQSGEMKVMEFVNLKEMEGFNYSDYLIKILGRIRIDKFKFLTAYTEQDILDGLLDKQDVEKLRIILRDGFRKNKTIRQMQREIENSIVIKDRLKDGKITMSAKARPNAIVRTETVRLANLGLIDTYKENGIEKVRFLAALSDRTCPICEGLNGQVFTLEELDVGVNQPPIHTSCRCSLVSVVE